MLNIRYVIRYYPRHANHTSRMRLELPIKSTEVNEEMKICYEVKIGLPGWRFTDTAGSTGWAQSRCGRFGQSDKAHRWVRLTLTNL